MPHTGAVRLLGRREQKLQRPVRDVLLAQRFEHLQERRHAREIVGAEHGVPCARDPPVFVQHGPLAAGRRDGIHVRAEQQRRLLERAGHTGKEVAGRAAERRARIVLLTGYAERREPVPETVRHRTLAEGGAVHRDELRKCMDKTFCIDLHRFTSSQQRKALQNKDH